MKLKWVLLVFAALFLVLAGCADDSDDDSSGGDSISWTLIFYDYFNRADTNYVEGDPAKDSLGANYRAYSQNADGNIEILSNAVTTSTSATAEYQTPMTEETVRLSIKFSSDAFINANLNGVYLSDAISAPAGCQVAVGYASDGTDYTLRVVDKDTVNSVASTAVTLSVNTWYKLEMIVHEGVVTGNILDGTSSILATVTASAATTGNKYAGCLIQEPAFTMELAGNVIFDDFTISTGE